MYRKSAIKPEGKYWVCQNEKCATAWEVELKRCQFCGNALRVVVVTVSADGKEEKSNNR